VKKEARMFKSESKLLDIFNFSSLTDIVLQLLIFFLLTSSFVLQTGIKVQLPKAETGEPQAAKNIVLTITGAGDLYVNGEQLDLSRLGAKLAGLIGAEKDKIVIIHADQTVSLQRTVEVIDVAKAVGASKFMIATVPK
jgi:biopolymer transport protein ExbD